MTNEEIVKLIQEEQNADNKTALYLKLWHNIERLVLIKAKDRVNFLDLDNGLIDDLLQEAYISLSEAVESFEIERGVTFASYYMSYFILNIRGAFNRAIYGGDSKRFSDDPLNKAVSIDKPLKDNNNNNTDFSLTDIIQDPDAENELTEIEETAFLQSANELIHEAINNLPEKQRLIVTYIVDDNGTIKTAFENKIVGKVSYNTYADIYRKGKSNVISWIKRNRIQQAAEIGLSDFMNIQEQSYYDNGSLQEFKRNHISIIEYKVLHDINKKKK